MTDGQWEGEEVGGKRYVQRTREEEEWAGEEEEKREKGAKEARGGSEDGEREIGEKG